MKPFCVFMLIIGLTFFTTGCATTAGSASEKRTAILKMQNDTLTELYTLKPHAEQQVKTAPGYAVFSNANVNLILASFGGGYGVVKNNQTGQHTFMKMAEVGVGLGAGAKDFRIIMVFDKATTLDQFIAKGWTLGAQADAAAKATDRGAAVGGELVINGITVYQLTETGLALQATVKGTKFWQDPELN